MTTVDLVYNNSKGRVGELGVRVNTNDPTNSVFIIAIFNSTDTDAAMRDFNTFTDVEGSANTAEVGQSGYARKVLDQTAGMTSVENDTDDKWYVDIADQTWTAVASGGSAWTNFVTGYLADSTGGTGSANNANIRAMTSHQFAITTDGSDITAQIATTGFYSAA